MFTRKVIEQVLPFLNTHDIILLYGARQVGKTTLMKILQKDYITEKSCFFDLEDPKNFALLNQDFDFFIEYLKSVYQRKENENIVVFIDEIQYLDNPTSFLKYLYDKYPTLKFIISGSSTFEIRGKLKDSLVGRLMKFEIFPLSFEEFLIFKEKTHLANLIWKPLTLAPINASIINNEMRFFYEEYLKFGGYPKVVLTNEIQAKKLYLKQIFDTYIQKDIKDIGKIKEVEKFNKTLKVLANQAGNLVNVSEIASTIWITVKTLNERLFLLENTFVISLIHPFSHNKRGELTKMPKLFFIDNGVRNFCDDTFELTGNNFENSFFASINNAYKAEHINFYRTQDKKEIDFILDGEPYELKLSYTGKRLTALKYFEEKYGKKGKVITLEKPENADENVLFPREI